MTVLEVKEAVLGYGYSRDLGGSDGLFYTSLNLAMQEVNRIRPALGTVVIVHEPAKAVASWSEVSLNTEENPLTYTAVARSLVFEVSGSGGVEVTGAKIDGADKKSWNAGSGWMRLVATADTIGEIKLSFKDGYFYVRNVSAYAIPANITGEVVEYDLKTSDFARATLPIVKDGVEVFPDDRRAMLIDGRYLRLPNRDRGTYEVRYEKTPQRFKDKDSDKEEILMDADLAELLPLLVASYVWRDDEPEKASAYYSLYSVAASRVRKPEKITHWVDRKGWT